MEIDLSRFRIRSGEIEDHPAAPHASVVMGRNEGENWITDPSSLGLGLKAMIGFVCDEVGTVEKMSASDFVKGLRAVGLDVPDVAKVRTVDRTIPDADGDDDPDKVEGF